VALGGGAYAANGGLTGKQKKEVEKIAKKVAKPGPAGKQGPAGAAGPSGAKGDAGAAGAAGAGGKGLAVATLTPGQGGCTEGGVSVEVEGSGSKKSVCNGEEGFEGEPGPAGSPWVAGGTLPSGKTETGTVSAGQLPKAGFAFVPISFPIPLAQQVAVNFVPAGMANPPAQCPSGSWEFEQTLKPEAAPGNLCIYETGFGFGFTFQTVENPELGGPEGIENPDTHVEELLSGKTGAVLEFEGLEGGTMRGVWAVTAG
jgi:hypothetical protein